ncbi:MAG: hypothetical protein J6E32_08090 [Lachnospiraceae bacterium]|nr:hypothetical protein [Lachnospiraceae bacterium]
MKERLQHLRDMLSIRNVWDMQEEEDWEDYDQKENYISGEEYADDTKKLAGIGTGIVYLAIMVMILIAFAVYFIMSRYHLYTGYTVTASYEAEDISGTRYEKLGNGFVKYGSDGVTFVNGKNEAQWSTAYTIETPMTDISGETLLIYEQQGYYVQIVDTDGALGSYQTDLPILKGVVARNGVAALMLKDDKDVRIRLLSTDGTSLAEVRTTLEDQGQPLDIALSSDARMLMVSLAKIGSGTVDSVIAFYDFSSSVKSDETHLASSIDYRDRIFPSVCFLTDSTAAAVSDSGFVTYSMGKSPKEKASVTVNGEILSAFHDSSCIGFVMASDSPTERYRLVTYRLNGRKRAETSFSHGYSQVRMDSGEILLNDSGHMMVFTPGGVARLNTDYDKQIGSFVKIPGFRRYAVLTNSGMERIKIE